MSYATAAMTSDTTATMCTGACSCCGYAVTPRQTYTYIIRYEPYRAAPRITPEFPRDARWKQHYMAYYAWVWPDVDDQPETSPRPPVLTRHVRRFGREGLGVRNWRRLQ